MLFRVQVCGIGILNSSHPLTTIGQIGYILSNEARRIPGSPREKKATAELSVKEDPQQAAISPFVQTFREI